MSDPNQVPSDDGAPEAPPAAAPRYAPPPHYAPPTYYGTPSQQVPYQPQYTRGDAHPQQRAAPGYEQPYYPAELYGPVPPQPLPYGYIRAGGQKFWAMLFLFFIPYVGFLVAPIVAIVLCSTERRNPFPLVRENARWAANWALTVLTWQAASIVLIIVGVIVGVTQEELTGNGDVGLAFVIPGFLLFFIAGVAHLVVAIMGTAQANSRVFNLRLAIPYIREDR